MDLFAGSASVLARVGRRWPVLKRLRLRGLARALAALGPTRLAWRRIGPLRIGLDPRDRYQLDMLFDDYEQHVWQLFDALLRPGDCYVDIGAQLGFTAAIAARRIGARGRMLLFEPDPLALERLREQLRRAEPRSMPHTELVEAACSDRPGELCFEVSRVLGHSHVIEDMEQVWDGRATRIPVVAADDELESRGMTAPRILKIDAEGHEIQVLRGLQRTLALGRTELILVEKNLAVLPDQLRSPLWLHALIARHGYVGLQESTWAPVTRAGLLNERAHVENLFYVRDPALLDVFTGGAALDFDDGLTAAERDRCYEEARDPNHPAQQAVGLIRLAGRREFRQAIARAEALLAEGEDLDWLRGHLGYWLLSTGEVEKARACYEDILARHPDDAAAREMLATLPPAGG